MENLILDLRLEYQRVSVRSFSSKSSTEAEIMQCGLKRIHTILTIGLNKKDNEKRTNKSYSILFPDLGDSATAL